MGWVVGLVKGGGKLLVQFEMGCKVGFNFLKKEELYQIIGIGIKCLNRLEQKKSFRYIVLDFVILLILVIDLEN